MNEFSKRLIEVREALGYSRAEFAKKTDISHQVLTGIESEKSVNPTLKVLANITKAFPNINPAWLLNGVGAMFLDDTVTITPKKSLILAMGEEKGTSNIKTEKLAAGNEIANVSIYEKMVDNLRSLLDVANNTNAKLWARLDKAENERDLLFAK